MLNWSVNLFRISRIQLEMHFTFPLLLAYAVWEGWRHGGWTSAAVQLLFVLLAFGCVVLHELGHCFAARYYGVETRRILLTPIGGMAEFGHIPRESGKEIVIALAGPAVNVLLILVLVGIAGWPGYWHGFGLNNQMGDLMRTLALFNLLMGTFNLIPVFPMDGGRVLRAILAIKQDYVVATRNAATVAKVLALAGIALALWLDRGLLAVLFAFIFVVGELEYRAVRREHRDAEHLHTWLARRELLRRANPPPLPDVS